MTTLNTFQNSLVQYAGYTGATGATVVPDFPTGYSLAGTYAINTNIDLFDIAVPSSATSVVVVGKDIDITAGSIGIFIEDGVSAGFGVEITPSAITNQQVLLQAFTPTANGLTWVGSANIGGINTGTEAVTEMLAGNLLAKITKITFTNASGDFSDGDFWILYQ